MADDGTQTLVLDIDEKGFVKGADNAEKSLSDLDKTTNKADKNTKKKTKLMSSYFKGFSKSVGKSLKSVGNALKTVGVAIATGVGVLGGLTVAAGAAGVAILNSTKSLRDAERVFRLKGGEEGIEVLKRIRQFGSEAGIGLGESTESARRLMNSFKNTKDVEEVFKLTADLNATLGAMPGAEAFADVSDAMIELGALSSVTEGDLETFRERFGTLSPTAESIARVTGKSFEDVQDALSKGELATQDYMVTLRQLTLEYNKTGKAGEAALKISAQEPTAQLNRIGDALTLAKEKFTEVFFGDLGGTFLKDMADGFESIVNTNLEPFLQNIKGAIKGVVDVVKEYTKSELFKTQLSNLKIVLGDVTKFVLKLKDGFMAIVKSKEFQAILQKVGDLFVTVAKGAMGLYNTLKESIMPIIQNAIDRFSKIEGASTALGIVIDALKVTFSVAFEAIKVVLKVVMAIISPVIDLVVGLVAALFNLAVKSVLFFRDVVDGAKSFGSNVGFIFDEVVGAITGFVASMIQGGKDMINGLVDGILSMASKPIEAIKNVARSTVSAFKDTLGIASPSKVFMEQGGEPIGQGVEKGIQNTEKDVSKSSEDLAARSIDSFKEPKEDLAATSIGSFKEPKEDLAATSIGSFTKSSKESTEGFDNGGMIQNAAPIINIGDVVIEGNANEESAIMVRQSILEGVLDALRQSGFASAGA